MPTPPRRLAALPAALLIASSLTACGGGGGGAGRPANPSAVRGDYILALGDSDLPVAGPDGALVAAQPGGRDALTVISLPIREPVTPFAQAEVANSASGSPGAIAVSPDGRYAYVVETRTAAAAGEPREAASLGSGEVITTIDLSNLQSPAVLATTFVGPGPRAAAVSPSGRHIAIATTNPRAQLVVAPLTDGRPGDPVAWPLIGLDDDEAAPSSVAWDPTGETLAISLGERGEVMFYRFRSDADGLALSPSGSPVKVGEGPISGQFTKDGRMFLSLDAGGSAESPADRPRGPGRVSLIRLGEPGGTDHRVIGSAPTGLAPVGMALSGDGDLIACANTGAVNAGITGGSVTLIGLGRDGSLTPHGEFNLGAVPAGIGFDKSGRFVCVSQYASQDPEAADGEISFWRLRRGDAPALEQQPFFVGIGAGPHGSLIVR